jgi:hypothetical protein
MPADRVLGPDGFNDLFYKVAWPIIKYYIMNAMNTLWLLDARSFNLLVGSLVSLEGVTRPVKIISNKCHS